MDDEEISELEEEEFIQDIESDLQHLKTNVLSTAFSLQNFESENDDEELLSLSKNVALLNESIEQYKNSNLKKNYDSEKLNSDEEFIKDISQIQLLKEDEFLEKIYKIQLGKKKESNEGKEDENDILLIDNNTTSSIIPTKCPLTQMPFISPVSQQPYMLENEKDVCFHIFEEKEILLYVKKYGDMSNGAICPIIGCKKRIYADKLKKNVEALEHCRIRKFKDAERKAQEMINNAVKVLNDKQSDDEEGFDLTTL